jgi:hypothetical protein
MCQWLLRLYQQLNQVQRETWMGEKTAQVSLFAYHRLSQTRPTGTCTCADRQTKKASNINCCFPAARQAFDGHYCPSCVRKGDTYFNLQQIARLIDVCDPSNSPMPHDTRRSNVHATSRLLDSIHSLVSYSFTQNFNATKFFVTGILL